MKENSREEIQSVDNLIKDIEICGYIDAKIGKEDDFQIESILFYLKDYKRVLKELEELKDTNCLVKRYFKLKDTNTYLQKENEELKNAVNVVNKEKADWIRAYQEEKDKQFELLRSNIPIQEVKDLKDRILKNKEYTVVLEGDKEFPDNATEATFEKYINLKVLDELVERK